MIVVIDFETTGFKAGEAERRVQNADTSDNGKMVQYDSFRG